MSGAAGISHSHDSSCKLLLSSPAMVADLLIGFVHEDWPEKYPGNYVSTLVLHKCREILLETK